MSTYSFFFEKRKSNILTSLAYPGHNIQPISAVQWLIERVLLWLKCHIYFTAPLPPPGCVLMCIWKTHQEKISYHHIESLLLFSHTAEHLTHCKLSWKCVRALKSASPEALTFCPELYNHCSRDWKRVSRLFPYFFCFFWSLRIT